MNLPGDVAIGYHEMRLRWCRLALNQFVRRWGVYFAVVAMLVGAGAGSPLSAAVGAAAWTVMPLFAAASRGICWLLPAALLQTLACTGCVWALRSLLWPLRWRESESALPIDRLSRLRSDLVVVVVALLPLMVVQGIGAGAILTGHSGGIRPSNVAALALLTISHALAVALGVALLQRQRHSPGGRYQQPAARFGAGAGALPGHSAWPLSLLCRPLWRGPARRTGRLLLLGSLLMCVPGAGLLALPAGAGWWLSLQAAIALILVTRLNALAREEYGELFDACAMLPLRRATLDCARSLLCLPPLLAAVPPLAAGLWRLDFRPALLVAYVAACVATSVFEVFSQRGKNVDKAARWLFCLILCFALASEVLR